MQCFKLFGSILSLALLAGCGGGSSGSGVGSTPTPATTQHTTLTNLTMNDRFDAAVNISKFTVAKPSGSASHKTDGSQGETLLGGLAVTYNSSAKSYSVSLVGRMPDPTFGEAQRNAARSNAIISVYERTSGNRNESFVLFNPGSSNTKFALTYTSYGAYQIINDNGTSLDVNTAFFAFGIKTSSSDMPRTGTATYSTMIDGQFADSSGVYSLAGGSAFSVDFGSATFSYEFSPVGTNVLSGAQRVLPSTQGTGTITAAQSSFSGRGSSSTMSGHFFGPNAAEMGGVFSYGGIDGIGGGAIVGKKN